MQVWGGMLSLFSYVCYFLLLVNTAPSVNQRFSSALPSTVVNLHRAAQMRAIKLKPYNSLQQGGLIPAARWESAVPFINSQIVPRSSLGKYYSARAKTMGRKISSAIYQYRCSMNTFCLYLK